MINVWNKLEKLVGFLYLLGLLGMLSIILLVLVGRENNNQTITEKNYKDISTCWTLDVQGEQPVTLKQLGDYMDEEKGVLSMYYKLPKMNTDTCLIYRSKDVYTKVLVDEEIIYETKVYEGKLYNKSPGNLWNILNITSEHSEKSLEIQIYMVYDTSAIVVDSLLLGDKADIILGLFADNFIGIIISLLLILLGFVLLVVDLLPSYGRSKKHHGLFWVGTFAIVAGMWSLIETNMLQFCVDDMRILQLIDNICMMLPTVPLILYLNTEFKILQNKLILFLAYLGTGYVLVSVCLQYNGTYDLHHVLSGALYLMVVSDFVMCIWLFIKCIKQKLEKKPILECVLMFLGVFACCSCTVFETLRSLRVDRMDRAGLIRLGMLALCVLFAIASQIDTYKIVEQGLKYDLVSKLAYLDGLTGLGNRTAYLEQIEEYAKGLKEKFKLGVIYLDVNNLKKTNDVHGHEYGDELIKICAKIIEDSFGAHGKSFRVGGDEFCVLIASVDPKKCYEEALSFFYQLINEANAVETHKYEVQIAHGFAMCEELSKENLEDSISLADSAMYQDKKKLKLKSELVG